MYLFSISLISLLIFSCAHLFNISMPDPIPVPAKPVYNMLDNTVPQNFPKISISILNCNSLNMASVNKQTRIRKFYGIVSLKSDVILFSDIRMCNKGGVSDVKFINDILAVNPYC
jgi:hypothetical protein